MNSAYNGVAVNGSACSSQASSSEANDQSPNMSIGSGTRDSNNNGNNSAVSPNSVGNPNGNGNSNGNGNGERLSRTNLYIRGLSATTSDQDLFAMCKHFGKITSTKSITDSDGKCRGYGFVDFEHADDAERALRELQKQNQQVQFARQQEQDPTNLYVQNLPPGFSETELERMFARYGAVVSTRILRSQSGASKGVGFSRMESSEKCELVIRAYNGSQLPGADEPLIVKFADGGQRKRMKQQQAAAAHAAASAAVHISAAQIVQQQQIAAAFSPALLSDTLAYLRAQNLAAALSLNGYSNAALLATGCSPLAQLSRVSLAPMTTVSAAPMHFATSGSAARATHQLTGNVQMSMQQQSAATHARTQSAGGQAHQQDYRDGSMLANGNAQTSSGHQYYLHQNAQGQTTATMVPLGANESQLQQLAIAVHGGQQYLTAAQTSMPNAYCGTIATNALPGAMSAQNALLHTVPLAAAYYNEYN